MFLVLSTSFCESQSEEYVQNVLSDDFRAFVVLSIYLTGCPMSKQLVTSLGELVWMKFAELSPRKLSVKATNLTTQDLLFFIT